MTPRNEIQVRIFYPTFSLALLVVLVKNRMIPMYQLLILIFLFKGIHTITIKNPINQTLIQNDGSYIKNSRHLRKRFRSQKKSDSICSTKRCKQNPCCSGFVCKGRRKRCVLNAIQMKSLNDKQNKQSRTTTYEPGNLSVRQNGLLLSKGLKSRIIAISNQAVFYNSPYRNDRYHSNIPFHMLPDAGACFSLKGDLENGWIYVSNSEESNGKGGVYALRFDSDGNVISYQSILTGTSRNCGGGKSPWNTWISCEENGVQGQCFEVDPTGQQKPNMTVLGWNWDQLPLYNQGYLYGNDLGGGNFESVAYDDRDPMNLHFFVTHDSKKGELRKYTPSSALLHKPKWEILTNPNNGTMEYLYLYPSTNPPTFSWTKDRSLGEQSAKLYFGGAEGIDVHNGRLYFTSKLEKRLFILNLDTMEYTVSSTEKGAFAYQPDQIKFAIRNDRDMKQNSDTPILYFCEDGGLKKSSAIHGRDQNGNYFTILEGIGYNSESTGLAFSPNNKFMYVAYQKNPGTLIAIWREDGESFYGGLVDIKYHSQEQALSESNSRQSL